jgi:hypothetical protein
VLRVMMGHIARFADLRVRKHGLTILLGALIPTERCR